MRNGVLIETYWNVNMFILTAISSHFIRINRNILECKSNTHIAARPPSDVLIETYWNVNSFVEIIKQLSPGINRNILECK